MQRWAFHSQVFFAVEFLRTHKKIAKVRGQVCQDRSLYDSLVFADFLRAQKILSGREHSLLRTLIEQMLDVLNKRKPDVIVYLEAPPQILLRRIQIRGIPSERVITRDYLEALQQTYEKWVSGMSSIPVIRVDSNRVNFLERKGIEIVQSYIHRQ